MEQTNIIYSNLEELSGSDYKLTDGEADIKGWPVRNEGGLPVGKVLDLLFDPANNAVRYIIIALNDIEKTVLIPIGIADLGEDENEIILPDIHQDQYTALPQYIIGEVTHETEAKIRNIIGSPAALRMEETIVEIDRENFYRHHHFDKPDFLNRTRRSAPANTENLNAPEREEERHTIHQLIDHSKKE